MKVYESNIIHQWDEYTIENEPISSIDLMERAASKYANWFAEKEADLRYPIHIFCGSGNNGGDGLVIARLLAEDGYAVKVVLCKLGDYSQDNKSNQHRLPPSVDIVELTEGTQFNIPEERTIAIDAVFGVGLNRPIEGSWANLIQKINTYYKVYAVDIPSGLFAEPREVTLAIEADYTLSFQTPKLSFFFPEFEQYTGEWEVCSIGLLPGFSPEIDQSYEYVEMDEIRSIIHSRKKFSHKGNYGHALLFAGSLGKIGAAILSAEACLRSGVGLLSIHAPKCAYTILQTKVPEAMVQADLNEHYVAELPDELSKYKAIGIGPGLDTREKTHQLMHQLLNIIECPLVIDADGLNLMAKDKQLLSLLPKNCILTPHPGEFDRLFGQHEFSWERLETAISKAKELRVVIVLKGAYTAVISEAGKVFFNSSGNSGMASGGTGDVLTGIILALLAQGYDTINAGRIGVYLHGLAADLALEKESCESMIATDIISHLGTAFKHIEDHC